ncbi:cytochrome P450 [Nocardia anaemiae]|uniref:cytochrome P450 n=1 Tax=Nocardia anaemiae TaxID=263910 RepID=UPI000B216F8C|nr:cytochrome P450 [Nocardia anaemiae]
MRPVGCARPVRSPESIYSAYPPGPSPSTPPPGSCSPTPGCRSGAREDRQAADDLTAALIFAADGGAPLTKKEVVGNLKQGVVMSYRAIGRDTAVHGSDADDFDITRPTANRHLAFGYGPHICPGAALSKMEAGIGLPALFERFPKLRFAVPVEEIRNLPVLTQNDLVAFPVYLA